ncbi:hypothetical protein K443DRAFT_364864 [Laccaria amethystina LaAM-08-1]|uniref:Uncharacterized protein n=1 Tax=Laccaria amethystina LaAM-08-1 TaxID=1095629 RepID=A0A0C9WRV5_9AGAR|nr:hypothetical protein K443DRAFT_364864 [Laccaria amethystina LaAM-08-1]
MRSSSTQVPLLFYAKKRSMAHDISLFARKRTSHCRIKYWANLGDMEGNMDRKSDLPSKGIRPSSTLRLLVVPSTFIVKPADINLTT